MKFVWINKKRDFVILISFFCLIYYIINHLICNIDYVK
jgi:hypothetical protein